MYIRQRPVEGTQKIKVMICESIRIKDKVLQKTIRQVGTARNDAELNAFLKAAQMMMHEIECERAGGQLFDDFEVLHDEGAAKNEKKTRVKVANLKEIEKRIDGPIDIFSHIAESMKIDSILEPEKNELLKHLISLRISEPASKLRTRDILEKKAGFQCSVDAIYRLLSELGSKVDDVNKTVCNAARDLFDSKVDLMFFDVTTLYFESKNQDELRDFGFSKDCKFGEVQVTLALATQKNGFPVGYKLFPGNTAEVSTLIKCVEEWKENLAIDDVIFVADRGMFSAKNLHLIQSSGYKFVVGCPLRKLGESVEEQIFDDENFKLGVPSASNEIVWSKRLEHTVSYREKLNSMVNEVTGHLIICHSATRAKKDAHDRETMIAKAKKKYESKASVSPSKVKELIGNRGYVKYLRLKNADSTEIQIDEAKIKADAKWDGISGVFTNTDMTNLECLSKYRGLWQIEDCFRISKSNLKIRPVFHFSPLRIQGHIALCFLSLAVLKYTQTKLAQANIKLTIQGLIDELSSVGSTLMEDKFSKVRFRVPSKLSETCKSIYQALELKRSESAALA